ncbi:MAG: cephalosporin hydroxylase family protein [Cyanobium usitatum Tobar12.5m-G36]|nr:cephalosporin hydroxylase family protein [Cyanobium usitatum Tobar12.5m-G36]
MALERKYMNSFSWLGRPLIQFPGDVMAVQELISTIRPTVVIETGIAHGGSLILSSSMLKLNQISGKVIGVDIEIRSHNRKAIESHPHSDIITLYEGSSTDPKIVEQVWSHVGPSDTVMVFLDSNHTHDHVLSELNAYSDMVSVGSYLVVFDTHVEDMPDSYVWHNRPWGKGNNPKTAVHEWIKSNHNFEIDSDIENLVLITSAPDGFLYRRS